MTSVLLISKLVHQLRVIQVKTYTARFLMGCRLVFSERELTFTFAMLSPVGLSVVCLSSVVCNVRAPYSGGSNFQQYFYGIRYLGHPWTSNENFTEIVPGEPLRQGS